MKKVLMTCLTALLCHYASAQYALKKGENQLNAGFGFSNWGLPIYIGLDHGVHTDISAGAEISFRNHSERFLGVRYRTSVIGISGNANYHFNGIANIPEEFDVYAGLNVGFYIWDYDDNYPGSQASGLGLGAQLGGRYYFSNRAAINLEVGGGNAFSGGKIGITIKI